MCCQKPGIQMALPLIGKGRPGPSLGKVKQPLKREDKIDQDSFQDVSRYKRVSLYTLSSWEPKIPPPRPPPQEIRP